MWIELHIKTSADNANTLGDQLSLLGASAVTFQDSGDQPIYEPEPGNMPLWQDTTVVGPFDETLPVKPILTYFEQQQATGQITNCSLQNLADQDWERVCLQHFKPIRCGKRLWICPSWHTPPKADAVNVILDPGLAFGTGTHPTTALCLEWLDQNMSDEQEIIDYGCGSGILGIAALKLGASHVIAVDNDPQAIEATEKNGIKNHFQPPQLETQLASDANDLLPADLVIANILAQPLIDLAPRLALLVKPKKRILLSGILLEQIDPVQEAYHTWIAWDKPSIKGEWACLAGTRTEGRTNKL